MPTYASDRQKLLTVMDALIALMKKANGWEQAGQAFKYGCILPGVSWQELQTYRNKLDPNTTPASDEYLKLVKHDVSEMQADHGTIEFTALAHLLQEDPKYDPYDTKSRKYAPVKLFHYPRDGDPFKYSDYGLDLYFDVASFSIDYDFRPTQQYYLIRLNEIKLALEPFSVDPTAPLDTNGKPKLHPIFATPPIAMTVEIKIPKSLDFTLSFPDITFDFFGFQVELSLNFPSLSMDWSPLKLSLPDWLNWPFGPISFGSIFSSNFTAKCDIAFAGPGWFKFPKLNIDLSFFKAILARLRALLGLFSMGESKVDFFAQRDPPASSSFIPEWVAIYANLTGVAKSILGGYQPKQLHLLVGIHKSGQLKVGLLSWTRSQQLFSGNTLMFQSAMQLDFEVKEDKSIAVHPGFSVEVLSGQKYSALATWAAGTSPPVEAKLSAGSFAAQADRVAIEWDKDEKDYVVFVEGAITIKDLLKDTGTSGDLTLPIKGIGISTSGRLVLKNTWITLDKALQAKVDDFGQVVLFLRRYGYGKRDTGAYWFGFSGDIELPVLNVKAGVERLVFTSDGDYELAGVRIDLDLASVLTIGGAAAWGEGLNAPPLPGISMDGFGGELNLYLKPLSFGTMLEMTYVNCTIGSKQFVAWSFYLDVPLPVVIPVCYCLGINSLGLMLGQNYIPLPKQNKIPVQKWLAEGFDGDVDNILKVLKYWSVESGNFAAGFAVGLATTLDSGYIINARAILVLVVPGPIIMIAGKANILSRVSPNKGGAFDLLIVYDQDDPGVLINLSFRYDVKYLITVQGMVEIYFSFTRADDWHFYLGTPEKPVAGRLLCIFEAKGYLTIDPTKLAAGAMVQYGYKWDKGPITLKYYISFSADLVISWNPAFVHITVGILGEAAIRIFGFGLGAGLRAGLKIKAPDPWYLLAEVEAKFSISLLFFSWSWTAHFELSWGSDDQHPEVYLDDVHKKEDHLSLSGSAASSNASLLVDSKGDQPKYYLPMDGVLGLRFLRDIDIDTSGAGFPTLAAYTPVGVRDEVSKEAHGVKRFHGKLQGLEVHSKNGAGWSPVAREIYFAWTPHDAADRKKLIVRDFDLGYSQFQLNDDPNARVKLTCPKFYETTTPLRFWADQHALQEVQGQFAVESPLVLPTEPPAEVTVTLSSNSQTTAAYKMGYPKFQLELSSDPVIWLNRTARLVIGVDPGLEMAFTKPSAYVTFEFEPDQAAPAAAGLNVKDFLTLYDETGSDITTDCHCSLQPTANGFVAILAGFGGGPGFSTQLPPRRGIAKIIFERSGSILPATDQQGPYHVALYPLDALEDIHRRNVERLEQKAKLEYVFGQNGDPGKLLWQTGAHRVKGKALWSTDQGEKNPDTSGQPAFEHEFHVIKPFQKIEVQINGDKRQVQPFKDYLRALVPAEGARPVYRQQLPAITYRCNYVNAMLKLAGYRLAMVLEDAEGNPSEYTSYVIELVPVSPALKVELATVAAHTSGTLFENATALKKKASELVEGLDGSELEAAYGEAWAALSEHAAGEETSIAAQVLDARRLLHHARGLQMEGDVLAEEAAGARAAELEKVLTQAFQPASDQAVIIVVAGQVNLIRIRTVKGLVEFRYTNDDLALDVSSLTLSDCLAMGQAQELNGYERGYFQAIVPQGATWDGLRPNTSYTAKFYSLDANDDLATKRSQLQPVHSVSFTTSLFGSIDDLAPLFGKLKVRDVVAKQAAYDQALSKLKPGFARQSFDHPGKAGVTFPVGMEVFRELDAAAPISAQGKTTHQVEEAYQTLYESRSGAVYDRLKAEHLALEGILASLGLSLEPTSPKRIMATWFRTEAGSSGSRGTIGLLLEFPEPLDWDRTGISVKTFDVQVAGEASQIDLLNPPSGNPSYEATFYWLRSLDGTKLMLIPKLVKTSIYSPVVVLPQGTTTTMRELGRLPAGEFHLAAFESAVLGEGVAGTGRPAEILPGRLEGVAGAEGEELASSPAPSGAVQVNLPASRRIADYAVASSSTFSDKVLVEGLKRRYGSTTVSNVSEYEVKNLELLVYHLAGNYPDKEDNYRAIPRLKFFKGQPGDADGKVGTLRPVK